MGLDVGLRARIERTVTDADTAIALGSGDVPVLATPRLLAWAEAATVAAVDGQLDAASTSVGSRVEIEHRAPTAVGSTVAVRAELVGVDGPLLRFDVTAVDAGGRTVASGQVLRAVVDRDRFLARLTPRS
jgi:predicted thioesterase